MDERILHHLQGADEIWHAGDIGSIAVMEPLEKIAPVRAVYGNIDGGEMRRIYPEHQIFEVAGLKVWITHIAGRPGAYPAGIREGIALHKPHIFICGHSHICLVKRDPKTGMIHMNPGAAGRHGFHKVRTMLKFKLDKGQISDLSVVELGARSAV